MSDKIKLIEKRLKNLPLVNAKPPKKVGYVVNYSFHIWYKVVMDLMKARAAQYGIEVLIRDAKMELATELAAMDELIGEKVDVLIVTPVSSPDIAKVIEKATSANIPLVLEANPVPGMTTMVAICDYDAGVKAGKFAGHYAKSYLGGVAKVLDIALPTLRPCLLRSEGFFDGLKSIIPDAELVERGNGEAMVDISANLAKSAFAKRPDINIVFGMDDESIHGGLHAVEEMGCDSKNLLLVGFGMAGDADKDLLMNGGSWKASTAMFPEWVGLRCIDQAVKVFNGLPVDVHDVAPTVVVTTENLTKYFSKTDAGWIPEFAAIAAIEREKSCTQL